MNAADMIAQLATANPGQRWATNARENIVGVWCKGKFYPVAAQLLTYEWAHMHPVLVNGQPIVPDDEWKEIV